MSEIATLSPGLLILHKVFHVIGAVLLIAFSFGFLIQNDRYLLGVLLATGAAADIIQVLTLNKSINFHPLNTESHQIYAWLMLGCYLAYAVLISNETGIGSWAIPFAVVTTIALTISGNLTKFKNFWIIQNIGFISLAVIIYISHYSFINTW